MPNKLSARFYRTLTVQWCHARYESIRDAATATPQTAGAVESHRRCTHHDASCVHHWDASNARWPDFDAHSHGADIWCDVWIVHVRISDWKEAAEVATPRKGTRVTQRRRETPLTPLARLTMWELFSQTNRCWIAQQGRGIPRCLVLERLVRHYRPTSHFYQPF